MTIWWTLLDLTPYTHCGGFFIFIHSLHRYYLTLRYPSLRSEVDEIRGLIHCSFIFRRLSAAAVCSAPTNESYQRMERRSVLQSRGPARVMRTRHNSVSPWWHRSRWRLWAKVKVPSAVITTERRSHIHIKHGHPLGVAGRVSVTGLGGALRNVTMATANTQSTWGQLSVN